ncbi:MULTISPECIES: MobP2 family relaxase [Caproicibacterium]|uniref:MobP2 family relaxase n=1 Tax=Caproicibacterium argilliputei TaxID=3030016 RepID=A0AA97H2L3_9FIRM|nr:MobP2 family relaxase [Caproicibacterium argilliputei]WOC32357.1 MobP2 family relaxase [Caproicibacterium argilliputei]
MTHNHSPGPVPGVVMHTKFVMSGDKRFRTYVDYMDRDNAIRNDKYQQFSAYMTDYMDNPAKQSDFNPDSERTSALFTSTADALSDQQKRFYKSQFTKAQRNGSPMWQTVVSFRNDWLQEHGLYDARTGLLDEAHLRTATRSAMTALLKNEGMQDSAVWTAAMHYNTDNIHIHIAVVEPQPSRKTVLVNGEEQFRGKWKQSSLDKVKSQVANRLVDRTEDLQHINSLIRNNIIAAKSKNLFQEDHQLRQQFLAIYHALPHDRRTWKYNMGAMQSLRPQIDRLTKAYIDRYHPADFAQLTQALKKEERFQQSVYGTSKRDLHTQYGTTKLRDLYTRMGNSILTEMREYDRLARQRITGGPRQDTRPLVRRAAVNHDLDRALGALKKALRSDNSYRNQRDYETMLRASESETETESRGGF